MDQLGMFAKYWQAGRVKTRLAQSVGAAMASRLYKSFVAASLHRFAKVGGRRVLVYSPPARRKAFVSLCSQLAPGWELGPQADGDLGRRMQHYFGQAFRQGAQQVVLIGSDSPTLPLSYVEQAFVLLRRHACVLGPSTDGGYYLVGAREPIPPIFEGVSWSSPDVWRQTVARLRQRAYGFAVLPRWYDVDVEEDLRRLNNELMSQPPVAQDRALLHLVRQALGKKHHQARP